MTKPLSWRPLYVLFLLLAVLLIVVGQWGAGVMTALLTVALTQLVRIGHALELLTDRLDDGDPEGVS